MMWPPLSAQEQQRGRGYATGQPNFSGWQIEAMDLVLLF
jgi:hypothetical protein